ncbi:MAG: YggS family pyridoxal phosphate-dependent enzyme [Bacteroidota bacterium]
MNPIFENIKAYHAKLDNKARLVAVSKNFPAEDILEAYKAGQRIFGENKVQELTSKQPVLPGDIEWHFIGHLQTNKVKFIAPFVSMIHSIDRMKLLVEVNREAMKCERIIPCLLQFHIADEETKFGLDYEEACQMLESKEFSEMKNIRICGVMGMATFTENVTQVRNEFKFLKSTFDQLKEKYFQQSPHFSEISMGMSDDFLIALEEGSTLVRIGSAIFGSRSY